MNDSAMRERSIAWQTMAPLAAAWFLFLACHGPSPAQVSHSTASGPSVSRASWTWRVATDGEVAGAYPLVLRVLQDGKVAEYELVPLPDGRLMLPESISHSGVSFESIRPAGPEYGLSTTGLYEGEPLSPRVGLLVEEPATVIVECEDTNERFTAGLIGVSVFGEPDYPRSLKPSHAGAITLRCPPGGYLLQTGDPDSPPAIDSRGDEPPTPMFLYPGAEATFRFDPVEWEEVDIPLLDWSQERPVPDRKISIRLPWSHSPMQVDSSGQFRVRLPQNRLRKGADSSMIIPINAEEADGWRPYGALTLPDEKAVLLLDPPPLCSVTWPTGFQPLQRLRSAPLSIVDWPALWRGVAASEPTDSLRSWMQHELEGRWSDVPSHRARMQISLLDSIPKGLNLADGNTSHIRELLWSWESAEAAMSHWPARFTLESEWGQYGAVEVQVETIWDSSHPEQVWLMQRASVGQDDPNPSREWTHRAVWDRWSEMGQLWVGSAPLPAEPSSDPIEIAVWTHRVQCQDEQGQPVPFAPVRYVLDQHLANFAMADGEGLLRVHVFGSPRLVLDTPTPVSPHQLRLPGPFEAEQPERYPPRPDSPVLVYNTSKRWIDVQVRGLEYPHLALASLQSSAPGEDWVVIEQTVHLDGLGNARFRNVRPGSYVVHFTDQQRFFDERQVVLGEEQESATVNVIASESQ